MGFSAFAILAGVCEMVARALIGFVFVFLAVNIIGMIVPKDTYDMKGNNKYKKESMDMVTNFFTLGIEGLFNFYANRGGLSTGRLGGVSSIKLDYKTDIRVEYTPYSYETLYLKQFVGNTYNPYVNSWTMDRSFRTPEGENHQTVEALKIALPQLVEQGYEFVTISELFERQGETPKKGILYSSVTKYPCKNYTLYQEISSADSDKVSLDMHTLQSLGDTFAVEMEYTSSTGNPPVIALQRWTSEPSLWHAVQPSYSNGDKAVFLASDILAAFDELGIGYADIDGISISAYGGELSLSHVKLLVSSGSAESVPGDVNADGVFDVLDVVTLQKWLLAVPNIKLEDWKAADLFEDDQLDTFDLCLMKRALLQTEKQ